MSWKNSREAYRGRLVSKYNAVEAESYDGYLGTLSSEDEQAYLADIQEAKPLIAGQVVLDVGAGTGALTQVLAGVKGLSITALEPSPFMLERLKLRPELAGVTLIHSGCDQAADRDVFPEASFDAIVSRQVVNSLFDPLTAFRNWLHWLKPGGSVYVIDGIYSRDGWTGIWQEEVDLMPLSACQSLATIPYLLEAVGFEVDTVSWMQRTNSRPATRTKRYLVTGRRP